MSMIDVFIFSESFDPSTDKVIDYIISIKPDAVFKRFNYENGISSVFIELNNKNTHLNLSSPAGEKICADDVKSFWFRRGHVILNSPYSMGDLYSSQLKRHLDEEWITIQQFAGSCFAECLRLGDMFADVIGRKIIDLSLAKKSGLLVPSTIVTTSKIDLLNFYRSYPKIITKPLAYHINVELKGTFMHSNGSQIINLLDIEKLENDFFPIFAQQYIDKKIEIRVFFIFNMLFSMAIFSQNDPMTSIDYRNYNIEKPTRNVPFKLPHKVKKNIQRFIKNSKLSTGSIDIILDQNDNYYFLEVNPCGQFDWLSTNCNYYIEKHIAEFLMENP